MGRLAKPSIVVSSRPGLPAPWIPATLALVAGALLFGDHTDHPSNYLE
jgi:hypothetical protein